MSKEKLLVADDEAAQLETLAGYLKKQGFEVFTAANGRMALEVAGAAPVDLILTDMRMPEKDGLTLLREAKALNPDISVIVMTAYGNVDDAVTAMKAGADDYLQKPIDLDHLDVVLKKALNQKRLISENRLLREALAEKYQFENIITASAGMEEVLHIAGRAAQSTATVLLRGESGTGKEVIARTIHQVGPQSGGPFVAVNVAALPENLLESELFGHEKGAFTGADRQREGRFEMASGGTLFIDEIGEIPPASQVKLLRVLQERSFERLGGREPITVDVRVIAATNQNLEKMIEEGRFREDLFYRLNVICIRIPPLRDRKEEIPLFIEYFLKKFAGDVPEAPRALSREAMDILMKYRYPGNVRELENIIQRAVVLARGEVITTDDLAPHLGALPSEEKTGRGILLEKVEELEKNMIRDALRTAKSNQSEAARSLGISERHLRYKLQKYKMK